MKNYTTYITGFALLIMGWSCKEVYYPEDIKSSERIPVIQGMIHNDEVPSVKLSWALRYEDNLTEYISGAEIRVTDDLGNMVTLEETGNGYYTALTSEFTGEPGRIYTLYVRLPDGNEYTSSPELLPGYPVVDSLYADPGTREVLTYSSSNEPLSELQEGLFILADLSEEADSVKYYRFSTKFVKEITYDLYPRTLMTKTVFEWKSGTIGNFYSANQTVEYSGKQVLREHPVGFLQYDYNPLLETDIATAPYPEGWVLTFKVYSISAKVYGYYNSIARQLGSNDQMFAPNPSQVESTVQCITDPEKEVIGVFEASAKTTVYKAFAWKDPEVYKSRDLVSFPEDVGDGSTLPFPPEFWVPFN